MIKAHCFLNILDSKTKSAVLIGRDMQGGAGYDRWVFESDRLNKQRTTGEAYNCLNLAIASTNSETPVLNDTNDD